MKATLPGLLALCATVAPGMAHAIGFGDIVLQSRMGEPLRAEIRILSGGSDYLEPACFSLAAMRGADLPVITKAKTRLVRRNRDFFLEIVGTSPIGEPAFMVSVRAGCGADIERDYVLMPEPPLMVADAPSAPGISPVRNAGGKAGGGNDWHAEDGDTLESIAESRAADNPAEQRRLLAALKRANPDLSPDTPLLAGTVVHIPESKPARPARHPSEKSPPPPAQAAVTRRPTARPDKTTKAATAAEPKAAATGSGKDRLLLGAAPGDAAPAPAQPDAAPVTLNETVERIHKLENTLSQLQEEMQKMDAALALATETIGMQEKLEAARTQELAKLTSAATAAAKAPDSSDRGWIELLLSAVIGGGLSFGLAQFLTRRQAARASAPLISAPSALAPAAPAAPAPQPVAPPPTATETKVVDLPKAPEPEDMAQPHAIHVNFDDDTSLLQLAEILVSFGRIEGAADALASHIDEFSPNNFLPWSMLLDLYRRSNMRREFETLAAKMRAKFNVQIPGWDASNTSASGLKTLEDYTHIISHIENCWGKPSCMSYLSRLTQDTRAGQRSGFPLEVLEEIALLLQILENGHGIKRAA